MFKKQFKVKSNTQIKSSEKKSLKDLLVKKFPVLTDADVEEIFPKKETAFVSKVLTATSKHVMVYTVQKRAILFSIDDLFYPTVYLLWRYPQLGVAFTTNDFVIGKVLQGADLMMPGIYVNPALRQDFLQKQAGIVNNVNNKAAVAVGAIAMSSTQMKSAHGGKCVLVYHCHGDKLCSMEDMHVLPLPQLGMVDFESEHSQPVGQNARTEQVEAIPRQLDDAEFPPLGGYSSKNEDKCDNFDLEVEVVSNEEGVSRLVVEQLDGASVQEDIPSEAYIGVEVEENGLTEMQQMDVLLEKCFLTAIKYSKTLEIPMLTSSFYKLQMIPVCPEGKILDIKKSSHKKVGQFLKSMEKEGLIIIKEKKKGVETLESINKNHEKFISFYVDLVNRPKKPTHEEDSTHTRNIVESYAVTQAVLPLFKEFGVLKSETMTTQEIKNYVTTYVKNHTLQDAYNKRFVNVEKDAVLRTICKDELAVTWEDLLDKITSSMKSCFQISTPEEQTLNKGKIQPIVMSTQTRSGNKKVTIVDNLELYHIKMSEFAKECQHGVAASTSISRPSGKKSDQIMIQGNQILFVYNLLIDKYKIPKKYIRGLEFAPKTKK